MAEAAPPETSVYRFSVPVVFRKLKEGILNEIGQKKLKALVKSIKQDGLNDHLKKCLPCIHMESMSVENEKEIRIKLIVRSTDQLKELFRTAQKISDIHDNELSKTITEYVTSTMDFKLDGTLHVSAIMTLEQFKTGKKSLDDADVSSTWSNITMQDGKQRETYGEQKVQKREKKIILHVPIKFGNVSKVCMKITRDGNEVKYVDLVHCDSRETMYEADLYMKTGDLRTASYTYEIETWKYIKLLTKNTTETEQFHFNENPVQRDIMKGFEYNCVESHLSDILLYSTQRSDRWKHITHCVGEIDSLLEDKKLIHDRVKFAPDFVAQLFKTWHLKRSESTSLLLLIVIAKLLKEMSNMKRVREFNKDISKELLSDISIFRLKELPESCEEYMINLCLCLSQVIYDKEFCLLLFMEKCHPFLDASHFNTVISKYLERYHIFKLVLENKIDYVPVATNFCTTMLTLYRSDDGSNRSQFLTLINYLLLHLPTECVLKISMTLISSLSSNEQGFQMDLIEPVKKHIEIKVNNIFSPAPLLNLWSLLRPCRRIASEVKDTFERKVIEIIKTGKDSNSYIKELESLVRDDILFDSRENKKVLLTVLANSRKHCAHDLFIVCIKSDKQTIAQEDLGALCLSWFEMSIGVHVKAYKPSDVLAPYIALSRLCTAKAIDLNSDLKSRLCEAAFQQLKQHDLCSILRGLDYPLEFEVDNFVYDVFTSHLNEVIKMKNKSNKTEELFHQLYSHGQLAITSRITAGAVCTIMDTALDLKDLHDDIELLENIVKQYESWQIVLKVSGKEAMTVQTNRNYEKADDCLKRTTQNLKEQKVSFTLLERFQDQRMQDNLLGLLELKTHESLTETWFENNTIFRQHLKDTAIIHKVFCIIYNHFPAEQLPHEFMEKKEAISDFEVEIKESLLTKDLQTKAAQKGLTYLLSHCKSLLKLTDSQVFWNVAMSDILNDFSKNVSSPDNPRSSNTDSDTKLDSEETAAGPAKNETMYISEGDQVIHFLKVAVESGSKAYKNKWNALVYNPKFSMLACVEMFKDANFDKEIELVEAYMPTKIEDSIKKTLRRLKHLQAVEKSVDAMKLFFKSCKKEDSKFLAAIKDFELVLSEYSSTHSFNEVCRSLQTIFEIAEPLTEETISILHSTGSASNLVDFLYEIIDEDIRNLIDAVEDISEQHVQETSVASLIEVNKFLQPVLKSKSDAKAILELINKQVEASLSQASTMPVKIEDCMNNLHNLKSLYNNVANRSELTKEKIQNIVTQGKFHFKLNERGTDFEFKASYSTEKGKNSHSKSVLIDLRSRALLLTNKHGSKPCSESGELDLFVSFIDNCEEISDLVVTLHAKGHIKYKMFNKDEEASCLEHLKQDLESEHEDWCNQLIYVRNDYYLVNFLQGFHIHVFHTILETTGDSDEWIESEAQTILRNIHPDIQLATFKEHYAKTTGEQSLTDNKSFLVNIGRTLHVCFKNLESVKRNLSADLNKEIKFKDVVQKRRLFVAQLDEKSLLVVRTILTLYYNTVRALPEPNQVLFCTRQTSWLEIDLLLHRCLGASDFYGTDVLYCLANVEILPSEIQFKLVEALRNFNSNTNYLFAVVCRGSRNHPFIDVLSEFVSKVRPLSDKKIEEILQSECPNVTTITSEVAGLGKTAHIARLAHRSDRSLITLHISGTMAKDTIVNRLLLLKLREYNTLHIDIGSLASALELDTFLFELVVLRYVTTGKTSVYLSPCSVTIEIANSLNDRLRKSLQTAMLFKREHIRWQDYDNFVVSMEINSPVQVACHFLLLLGNGTLDKKDILFTGVQSVKPLSSQMCKKVLRHYFPTFPDISFSIVNIFLSVLADQLKKMSVSSFFRVSRITDMLGHNTSPNIRSSLVQALVDVSRDFASRSIDACRTNQISTIDLSTQLQDDHIASKAENIAKRVEGMIRWEDSNHLMYVYHNQNIQTISPIYRDKTKVPDHVKKLFESQMKKEMQDYQKMTQAELQVVLQKICRSDTQMIPQAELTSMSKEYALTPDNLLKMVLIVLRIKAVIPVLIMGETGCGKTSLIRYLAKICDVQFDVLNIHAGVEEDKILCKVKTCNSKALEDIHTQYWLFLDEINTSEHVGLISDVICHRHILSQNLAPNLTIIGACNPYKLRSQKAIATAGLKGKVKSDELSRLVYRVLPLPEMLVDYVWDFGSLNKNDERTYIYRMIEGVFPKGILHNTFTELLSTSQSFIRNHEDAACSVSLRDVHRCKILAQWFMEILQRKPIQTSDFKACISADITYKAMILALAHCYHCRISDVATRKSYRETTAIKFRENGIQFSEKDIDEIIKGEQQDILDRMDLPVGTAKNTALRENVFVLLVCILNRIPIFLVGKPGCSKSLSMQVIRSNLRGGDSKDDFFKTLPQLYCVSFQGSESSTSDGITKVFEKAEKYQQTNKTDVVRSVVILDEIGLAEVSRFNPLKVLHNLLEPDGRDRPNVAVVGISNWSLDASKMNRAIHLSRPEMNKQELYDTAISLSNSFVQKVKLQKRKGIEFTTFVKIPEFETKLIKDELQTIAESYFEYTKKIAFQNFHGLRDFYSLVKYFAGEVSENPVISRSEKIAILTIGLERNFGGLPLERQTLLSEFHIADSKTSCPVMSLINGNILDPLARHLMLITTGESVLGILEQNLGNIGRQNKEIIFGSQFDEDLTDDYNYRILNRIILCMEQGLVLILKDLECIYGSLYDMLNQNYTMIGKKKNCRVALGPYSNPICRVHDSFRCIVLVDDTKLEYSDPPFLNRFEKQYLRFSDIIQPEQKKLITNLEKWVRNVSTCNSFDEYDAFPIFSEDMVSSLILQNFRSDLSENDVIEKCKLDLLWILCPEVVFRLSNNKCDDISYETEIIVDNYMKLPIHSGIKGLVTHQLNQKKQGTIRADSLMSIIFTKSNMHTIDVHKIDEFEVQVEKLGAFKSEKQFTARMQTFWLESSTHILFVQCSAVDDAKHIMLAKSIIEKYREEFIAKPPGNDMKHTYLIVHIDWSKGASPILPQINFLSPWKLVTLDTLDRPSTELPELHKMTLLDALASKRPMTEYIKEQLFMAFTQIKYSEGGRNVESLTKLMTKIKNSGDFLEILESLIVSSVENNYHGIVDKNWQFNVACSRQCLQSASSFTEALESYIYRNINIPLVKYLYVLENENMIDTYFVDDVYSKERREVWKNVILLEESFSIENIPDYSGPESYMCSNKTVELKMPFSKFIFETIETTSEDFSHSANVLRVKCDLDSEDELPKEILLELQREQALVTHQIFPRLMCYCYSSVLDDYLDDFSALVSMQFCPGPSVNKRAMYAKQIILEKVFYTRKDLSEVINLLHTSVWIHLSTIRPHLQLFDACRDFLTFDDFAKITFDSSYKWQGEIDDTGFTTEASLNDPFPPDHHTANKIQLSNITESESLQVMFSGKELNKIDGEERIKKTEISETGDFQKDVYNQETLLDKDITKSARQNQTSACRNSDLLPQSFVENEEKSELEIERKENHDSNEDNEAKERLQNVAVQLVCQKMLPTQETVHFFKSINIWSMKVKEVLTLIAQLNPGSKSFKCLNIFSNIVSFLIIPFDLDHSTLYDMANCVQAEGRVHSETVFEAFKQLLRQAPVESSSCCQKLLANYFLHWLLSDPKSDAFFFFFNFVCADDISLNNALPFKPVLSHAFEFEIIEDENILFQILKTGIPVQPGENCETKQTFLLAVNDAIIKLHDSGKSECSFIVMIVDMIEEIFTQNVSASMEGETEFDPLEYLIQSRTVMITGNFGLKYVVAIAFFKAYVKFIPGYIHSEKPQTLNFLNVLLTKDPGKGILNTLESYIIKIIGQEKRSFEIKKNIEDLIDTIPNLNELYLPITDSFTDNSIDQCPLIVYLTLANGNELKKYAGENPGSQSIVKLMEATVREEDMLLLFAYAEKTFYIPRSYKVLDDSARTQANAIAKSVSESSIDKQCSSLLHCLLGTKEFGVHYLEHSEHSSTSDCLLNAFLVSVSSLAVVSSCKIEEMMVFQKCFYQPEKVDFNNFHSWLWSRTEEDCHAFTDSKDVVFVTCECQHRIATLTLQNEAVHCAICSKDLTEIYLKESSRRETMGPDDKYAMENDTMSPLYTVRSLSPVACQILSLLMKTCMIGSLALHITKPEFFEKHLKIAAIDIPQRLWKDALVHWKNIEQLLGVGEHSVSIFLHLVLIHMKYMLFGNTPQITKPFDKINWENDFNGKLQDLLNKRFELQKSMINHHRSLYGESNKLEDILLEVDNPNTLSGSEGSYPFATLFRVKNEPTETNFESELHSVREDFPLLSYITKIKDQLKLLPHIKPIVKWHMIVISCANYVMKKHECLNLTVMDFIHQSADKKKTKVLHKRFEEMQESWSYLKENFRNEIADEMMQMHLELKMESCIIYDTLCVQYRLLQLLVQIHNDILDHVLEFSLSCETVKFLMRSEHMSVIPCVKITEITQLHLLNGEDIDWPGTINEYSMCDTSYGYGKKKLYDFHTIERMLGRDLVTGKAFILFSSLPRITFTDELYKNYISLSNELKSKVKQKPLSHDIQSAVIDKQRDDPRTGKELLVQIGMIMTLLNRTGGDPEKCLIDYVDEMKNILTKQFSEHLLPSPTTSVKLGNIISLYELLEEINAESIKKALEENFRVKLHLDQEVLLKTMAKTDRKLTTYVLTACKRFIHRCLSLREADETRPLQEYIAEASFWPEGVFTTKIVDECIDGKKMEKVLAVGEEEKKFEEIIPKQIMVKNIYHTVDLIERQLEEQKEQSNQMSALVATWQNSQKKAPVQKDAKVKKAALRKAKKIA